MKQTRYSKQRELIYQTLAESKEHPSAEMIYQSLKETAPSLSLATVYRNLNLLVDEGRSIRIPCNIGRYDANTAEHLHFHCTECDRIYDLEHVENITNTSSVEALGYKVNRCDVIFKGICPNCMERK